MSSVSASDPKDVSVYPFEARSLEGQPISLRQFEGQVLLIVNVASECGFTPQYEGLESLYRRYQSQGFSVLGFPCNQFGGQEPGTHDQIRIFCQENYEVSFPLFERIEVNGANAHPLYQYLKSAASGVLGSKAIKWNFTKFLIGRNGQVLKRFAPMTKPEKIEGPIQRALSDTR